MAEGHYQVLARKWRPQSFEDVVGQQHITRTLQNAIRAGRIHHAFLFIGSRGIGKTTSARILAKALNCTSSDAPTPTPCDQCDNCRAISSGTSMDVIEIDGASNNSVEDVRQIRENILMVPASSRYKIYVIDEVHQLSVAAFNALLKTLEEPPPHGVFIMATTEAHKVPATIISRCQRYDFRRVGLQDLMSLLRKILEAEGFTCSDEALAAIARAADGGVRDSESILDQLMSYCDKEISFQDVFDVLGLVDWQALHDLCDALQRKDITAMLTIIEQITVSGKDLSQFAEDILRYFRNLLVCKSGGANELLALPENELNELNQRAQGFSLTELIRVVEQFSTLINGFDSQLAQRTALETQLIKMSKRGAEISVDTVLEKLAQLEAGGVPAAGQAPAPSTNTVEPAVETTKKKTPIIETAPAPQPTAPKTKPKSAVSADNLSKFWDFFTQKAAGDNISLAAWLPQAHVKQVENSTLIIEFEADQVTAKKIVEKNEHKLLLEDFLRNNTANLSSLEIQTKVQSGAAAQSTPALNEGLPLAESVNPEEGQKALEDPHVANVVDVFKGRIVDIQ
jgi:DNA polymerase-3 subunit gamma/tau